MTAKQSGQTLPLVALMMVCIMGIAALAVDGSNAYSQQRRMQADLDVAVKIAASEGSTGDAYAQLHQRGYVDVNSDGTRGITINLSPNLSPSAGPYAKYPSGYAEGFLTQYVRSFFAGVLGLKGIKISVHAVAEKGGNTWQPPQLLALSPDGASNGGCGVLAQGGAGQSGALHANVHSDSQTCVKSGTITVDGEVFSDIKTATSNGSPIPSTKNGTSGNGTGTFMSNPYNPNWTFSSNPITISAPMTQTTCPSNSPNPCGTSCWNSSSYASVAPGVTYYQPDSTGIALMSNGFHSSNGNTDFLPYCDSNGNPTFGIYVFNGDLKLSSTSSANAPVVNVYDSTFVFNYPSGAKIDVTGGSFNMQGPDSSSNSPFYNKDAFGSIAIWQVNAAPCGTPISSQLGGNATGTIYGIVDLPCTNITVTGNSTNYSWIVGALVAWNITIAGSGQGIVTQNPLYATALPSGAVLVQ